ncbi:MAG: flavin reductase family protein [Christensenellales bacterium]|jgi:flavin reductase (DIM6/NTAB) family NADH-FMN oxidoreductase RutF
MKKLTYFDTAAIYADIEAKDKFDMGDILTRYEDYGFSHRWIQPPVACYLINTMDNKGNVNSAPISMGTAMWGEPTDCGWYYCFAVHNRRQTRINIDQTMECVISYYPYSLLQQSMICSLPVPHGISEIDVAKLTPVPSRQVKAPSIAECVSNLEVKIVGSYPLSNTTLYIGRVVGCLVQQEAIDKDRKIPKEPGLGYADLLYEVSITGDPSRLNYTRMATDRIYSTDPKIGDEHRWIGNFSTWMDSEEKRGRISTEEKEKLLELNKSWRFNPDPIKNKAVKDELTAKLREICWKEI